MFKRVLVSVWNHGRRVVEDGIRLQKIKPTAKLGRNQEQLIKERNTWLKSDNPQLLVQRTWVQNIVGKSFQKFATNLRNANKFQSGSFSIFSRSFGQRSVFPRAPYFAFVGIGLAVASQKEELVFQDKQLIADIQNVVTKHRENKVSKWSPPDDLCGQCVDDYEFGPMISKGCNAAVHEAVKVKEDQVHEVAEIHDESNNLAIKVMFNLHHDSNYSAIMRGMEKEILPAKEVCENSQYFFGSFGIFPRKKKRLKPHPNIVDIKGVFVDEMKAFDGCESEYPASLPPSLCSWGWGRNKTLYIVMKRYDCTLRDYIESPWTPAIHYRDSLLMFSQLVEGILHLNQANIAHRDLKSDNILLDLSSPTPRLVICDFGCCVDGLRIPYNTHEVNKEGNPALMAPEIANAEPSDTACLDYTKSDLWAAGSLAYEIFGSINPFYKQFGWVNEKLNNQTYHEHQLPDVSADVPEYVNNLVKAMLIQNPEERPDTVLVANTLQLILWAPEDWLTHIHPTPQHINNWLLVMVTQCLLDHDSVESQMKGLFLSRLDLDQLANSFRFLRGLIHVE